MLAAARNETHTNHTLGSEYSAEVIFPSKINMACRIPTTLSEHLRYFRIYDRLGRMGFQRTYDGFFFKQVSASKKRRKLLEGQKTNYEMIRTLGPDITTAHFVTNFCKGSVMNQKNEWLTSRFQIPQDFDQSFKLKAIKANGGTLLSEGIDNFADLMDLQILDLSCNHYLDDFACDQMSRQFKKSTKLSAIDLSHNPLISIYGLEVLLKIPNLRKITAIGTLASSDESMKLFSLLAKDERQCDVITVADSSIDGRPEAASAARGTSTPSAAAVPPQR